MTINPMNSECEKAVKNLETAIKSDKWFIPTNAINQALDQVKATFSEAYCSGKISSDDLLTFQNKITKLSDLPMPLSRLNVIQKIFNTIFSSSAAGEEKLATKAPALQAKINAITKDPSSFLSNSLSNLITTLFADLPGAGNQRDNMQSARKVVDAIKDYPIESKQAIFNILNTTTSKYNSPILSIKSIIVHSNKIDVHEIFKKLNEVCNLCQESKSPDKSSHLLYERLFDIPLKIHNNTQAELLNFIDEITLEIKKIK